MKVSLLAPDKYPEQLRGIYQSPKRLYVAGTLPEGPMVAIVGSRRPTDYGRSVTYQLASELARAGVVIVSGLAIGLDGVAHQAALDVGGKTVAVLPSGLSHIYPSRHRGLAREILASGGALVSEYEPSMRPQKFSFVARNRIIAGLACAVVVTEATAASGTLTTAQYALNENRYVMAVPGNITSLYSAGPNNLIRGGAIAVTSASEILSMLDIEGVDEAELPTSETAAVILGAIAAGAQTSDEIADVSGLSAQQLAVELSLLEISGQIRNLGAGNWVKR